MSRFDISRWLLSCLAVSAAAAVGTLSAQVEPSATLQIEWAGSASPTAGGAADRSCSQQAGRGKGAAAQCPVSISLAPRNTLGIAVSAFIPGSTAQRAVDVTNDGKVELSGITLGVQSSTSTPPTDGSSTGLQVQVDRCAGSWDEAVSAETGVRTYSCPTGSQPVLSERPVPAAAAGLNGSLALHRAGIDHLLVTLRFPESAGLSSSGRSTVLTYVFNAVQKAGRP